MNSNTIPHLKITRRRLPHWTLDGSTYFVTFRLTRDAPDLTLDQRMLVLSHIRDGHNRFYNLAAVVVMPDHVHLLLKPNPGVTLSQIMKGVKGVSARKINLSRGTTGTVWQDESWDRIVRSDGEFMEKLEYMYWNPRRAELVQGDDRYPAWYCNKEFLSG